MGKLAYPVSRIVSPCEGAPSGREDGGWWLKSRRSGHSGGFACMDLDVMIRCLTRRDIARAKYYSGPNENGWLDRRSIKVHQWGILCWWARSWGLGWGTEDFWKLWLHENAIWYGAREYSVGKAEWCRWKDHDWKHEDDTIYGIIGTTGITGTAY